MSVFSRGFFNAKIAKIIAKNAMTIAFYGVGNTPVGVGGLDMSIL